MQDYPFFSAITQLTAENPLTITVKHLNDPLPVELLRKAKKSSPGWKKRTGMTMGPARASKVNKPIDPPPQHLGKMVLPQVQRQWPEIIARAHQDVEGVEQRRHACGCAGR